VCGPDVREAAEKWLKKHPHYQFSEFSVVGANHNVRKGRGDQRPMNQLLHPIPPLLKLSRKWKNCGDLCLPQTILNYPGEIMLSYYWGQGAYRTRVPVFKGQNIQSSRSVSQEKFPDSGTGNDHGTLPVYLLNDGVPINKSIENFRAISHQPHKEANTEAHIEMVFFLFRRVRAYTVIIEQERVKKITNLNEDLGKILALFCSSYEGYYL